MNKYVCVLHCIQKCTDLPLRELLEDSSLHLLTVDGAPHHIAVPAITFVR